MAILTNLAQSYADNGEREKALPLMQRILFVDVLYDGAYNNLGRLLQEMKTNEEAAKTFEKGLAIWPADPYLLNNYGYLMYNMGGI